MGIESLEHCLDPESIPGELGHHLESCAYCRAELDLLRSFLRPPDSEEAKAVRAITAKLRLPELSKSSAPVPWWKGVLQVRWLSPAAIALAGVLLTVAVGLQWRHASPPQLQLPNGNETEVLRSGSLSILAPAGDLAAAPDRIQWQAVPGAVQYRIQLLEVDHSELWSGSASSTQVDIPATVRPKIVPAKTLLVRVFAFDSSGHKLAESEFVRFRFLQKLYSR